LLRQGGLILGCTTTLLRTYTSGFVSANEPCIALIAFIAGESYIGRIASISGELWNARIATIVGELETARIATADGKFSICRTVFANGEFDISCTVLIHIPAFEFSKAGVARSVSCMLLPRAELLSSYKPLMNRRGCAGGIVTVAFVFSDC